MTPEKAVTTPPCSAKVRSERYAFIAACALVLLFGWNQPADAAPVMFTFETTTAAGAPFGHGRFSFDDALFPFPYNVEGVYPNAPDVFLDFFYTDPFVGVFGRSNVAASHFVINLNPFTSEWDPVNSKWAFVLADVGNFHVLQGDVSGLGPAGANTNVIANGQVVQRVVAQFPQAVPEPATLLMLATAVSALLTRRLSQR
jgi:hypothetical protein